MSSEPKRTRTIGPANKIARPWYATHEHKKSLDAVYAKVDNAHWRADERWAAEEFNGDATDYDVIEPLPATA